MEMKFLNREREFELFQKAQTHGGLYVIYGRRRIGKSRFLREFSARSNMTYYQAIRTTVKEQIQDLWETIDPKSEMDVSNWKSFFELLSGKIENNQISGLIIDEFPFLVESDPQLPSLLQRWCDQFLEKSKFLLICSGSSQRMMHTTFLNGSEPLYGRAKNFLKMPYLDYVVYLKFLREPHTRQTFESFSLMGGVPRYWLLSKKIKDPVELADLLYFSDSSFLQDESVRLLFDEGLNGQQPSFILDLIGRGCSKPSEIAARLWQTQGSLNKPLKQLIDAGFIKKDIPFGENSDTNKKVFLSISDPCLKFWYSVFSPLRNKWNILSAKEKKDFIHLHASHIWEDYIRVKKGGQRFWTKDFEIDFIALVDKKKCLVGEIKFTELSSSERLSLLKRLKEKWALSALEQKKNIIPHFKIFDITNFSQI